MEERPIILPPAKPTAENCPKNSSCPISAFTDAVPTAWYHDGVHYCLDQSLMQGMGDGTFLPEGTLSRAMMVQLLYNLEGQASFTDVKDDSWYAAAVSWAADKGLVQGYGAGLMEGSGGYLNPGANATRSQTAVLLYRFLKTVK